MDRMEVQVHESRKFSKINLKKYFFPIRSRITSCHVYWDYSSWFLSDSAGMDQDLPQNNIFWQLTEIIILLVVKTNQTSTLTMTRPLPLWLRSCEQVACTCFIASCTCFTSSLMSCVSLRVDVKHPNIWACNAATSFLLLFNSFRTALILTSSSWECATWALEVVPAWGGFPVCAFDAILFVGSSSAVSLEATVDRGLVSGVVVAMLACALSGLAEIVVAEGADSPSCSRQASAASWTRGSSCVAYGCSKTVPWNYLDDNQLSE